MQTHEDWSSRHLGRQYVARQLGFGTWCFSRSQGVLHTEVKQCRSYGSDQLLEQLK